MNLLPGKSFISPPKPSLPPPPPPPPTVEDPAVKAAAETSRIAAQSRAGLVDTVKTDQTGAGLGDDSLTTKRKTALGQ